MRGWLSKTRKRTVIVHTREDQSVRGVLVGEFADGIELRFAELLKSGGDRASATRMAGEVFVPRDLVRFVQTDDGKLGLSAHAQVEAE